MKFGIAFANIEPFGGPTEGVLLATAAEAAGFESIWTVDHVVVPAGYRSRYPYAPSGRFASREDKAFPDPLIWLAYLAHATTTIRLGTGILIVPQRNPVVLANELATLDSLSGGRMILGAGVGWLQEEFEALGVPFDGRGLRTEESIAAMRALWTQERASFEGATTSFRDCYLRPQPPGGTIPVHIGGHSEAAARRAGRIGDGYFPFGVKRNEIAPLVQVVRRSAEEAGRDPSSIELTVDSYATTTEDAATDVKALQALGATRVLIPAAMFGEEPGPSLERYGEEVISRT
ncbi:MAG: LLM class F420-dependent oxidoreductase [Acidimicrobiales bacterium]